MVTQAAFCHVLCLWYLGMHAGAEVVVPYMPGSSGGLLLAVLLPQEMLWSPIFFPVTFLHPQCCVTRLSLGRHNTHLTSPEKEPTQCRNYRSPTWRRPSSAGVT